MDYKIIIINTIGGLGLFLYGMRLMSEGLQHVAGDKMRKVLETVSANRWVAFVTGAVVTAVIQSSSATTVMLVGLVNAGLMNIFQAVGVALGANVGTTITAQLIAFKITEAALPAIAVGAGLKLFAQKRQTREIGGLILGFGLLFFGMTVMSSGVGPLKSSSSVVEFFTKYEAVGLGTRLLCVLTGTVATMILQSSSATVGLTMTLASQGLIDFQTAAALVLGDNIGTTITAELAAIGTGASARRTARANSLFNIIGVCYMLLIWPYFLHFVTFVTSSILGMGPADLLENGVRPNVARYVANAHTLFNVVNAGVFLFLLPMLINVATRLVRKKESELDLDMFQPQYLDERFLNIPGVALRQARREIFRMAKIGEEMMSGVLKAMDGRKVKDLEPSRRKEDALDALQREITNYLVQISQGSISLQESKEVTSLMRMVNNVERVGDAVNDVSDLLEEMFEKNIYLSPEGVRDYLIVSAKVMEFYRFLIESMEKGTSVDLKRAHELEKQIDIMREEMRNNHLCRLREGVCKLDPGLMFTDILEHFERIGDCCLNIAQGMAGVK